MLNPFKAVYAAWSKASKPLPANPFKRKVTIVYKTMWLRGTYAFTFKVGQKARILDAWADHMVSMCPDDWTFDELQKVRNNPGIEIIEVF